MPNRTNISSIPALGAGPISIGQACEPDFSATQSIKAPKG
jgi:carbamoyl-phosphate synthase large subunit